MHFLRSGLSLLIQQLDNDCSFIHMIVREVNGHSDEVRSLNSSCLYNIFSILNPVDVRRSGAPEVRCLKLINLKPVRENGVCTSLFMCSVVASGNSGACTSEYSTCSVVFTKIGKSRSPQSIFDYFVNLLKLEIRRHRTSR